MENKLFERPAIYDTHVETKDLNVGDIVRPYGDAVGWGEVVGFTFSGGVRMKMEFDDRIVTRVSRHEWMRVVNPRRLKGGVTDSGRPEETESQVECAQPAPLPPQFSAGVPICASIRRADADAFGDIYEARIEELQEALDLAAVHIHAANVRAGWWSNPKTGFPIERNVFEMLALIHSEISEALEGHRKGLRDDKLPEYPMIAVELADTVIRILDLAGAMHIDLGEVVAAKLRFNQTREDHKPENRLKAGGKSV